MKDAKGHGSNPRGGSSGSNPFDYHQHRIAVDTLKMPDAIAGVMGPPSKAEAEATLRNKFGYGDSDIAALKGGAYPADIGKTVVGDKIVTDHQAAASLAGGGSKSAAVPVHSGASGRSDRQAQIARTFGQKTADDIKAFTDKYGGPRDHAAEARGFASGKREINRLKRQGK